MRDTVIDEIEILVERKPRRISELARLFAIAPSDVRCCVERSCQLRIDGDMVVLDDMVLDDDYGLVYRKECEILRKLNVPTLRELKQRRAQFCKHKRRNAPSGIVKLARLIQERHK